MRKCWKLIRVGTLIATLSLTTALPVFANDSSQNERERIQAGRMTFEEILVSSLTATGVSPVIIAAVQKVREAVR
jgi:hypothetical protein